jgi:hypothetical protein
MTDEEGAVFAALPKTSHYARMLISTVVEQLGGARRLTEWTKEDRKNEAAFWTKIFTKMVQPEKAEGGDDSYAELLRRLDAKIVDIEADPEPAFDNE